MRHNRVLQIVAVVILAVLLGATYAYATLGIGNPRAETCKDFCEVANAEYGGLENGDCWCVRTDRSYDLQTDKMVEWKTRVNVGRIEYVKTTQPIPADIKQLINQQLEQQQQILQQQQQIQGGTRS